MAVSDILITAFFNRFFRKNQDRCISQYFIQIEYGRFFKPAVYFNCFMKLAE